MVKPSLILVMAIAAVFVVASACGSNGNDGEMAESALLDLAEWKEEQIKPEELINWRFLGQGSVFNIMNDQTCLTESDETQGVMLLSPVYYGGDVVVRYKALALTDASVFVTILSATDTAAHALTIPGNYDGSMGFWTNDVANYFFAFKNAPHGGTPFISKNPDSEGMSAAAKQDRMVAGVYYDIEVGKEGRKLWLSVDGEEVVSMEDRAPIVGGHVALRLRGTAGLKAAGLIKDLAIYSK